MDTMILQWTRQFIEGKKTSSNAHVKSVLIFMNTFCMYGYGYVWRIFNQGIVWDSSDCIDSYSIYNNLIALISSRSDEDNRGRRGGRSYNSGFTMFFNPTDLFWYWDPYYYRRRQIRKDDGMNFVESVFSFVFGDGDPNQGLEEMRWKMIGRYITSNGGVVTAEELAPYLDVMRTSEETLDDESYILPVLLRFEGHPEVDDEGNILYVFPSLQRTASSRGWAERNMVAKNGLSGLVELKNILKKRIGP